MQNTQTWICFTKAPYSNYNIVLWYNQVTGISQFHNPYCGVIGCHSCSRIGQKHRCKICGGTDHRAKSHFTGNRMHLTFGYCGVIGCISCKQGQTHHCKVCGGTDHRAKVHFK